MSTWLNDVWTHFLSLVTGVELKATLEFVLQKLVEGLLQAVVVVVLGWLVLYRQWRQLTQGRSDQVIFSANLFTPLSAQDPSLPDEQQYLLQLRTVLPPKTIDQLLDNVALRRLTRQLAERATLTDPILETDGTAGFEIVNDIVNCVSGSLASSPFQRDQWLTAITCEDRRIVRKCCIRVLLIRRTDLERMASWEWCQRHVRVEAWYHYWRIVTLHQIALRFRKEQARQDEGRGKDIQANLLPLVDRQAHHPRIRSLSLGINIDEPVINPPLQVDWDHYLPRIVELGLKLPGANSNAAVREAR